MGYKELKDVYKQTKPRTRTRSTVFEDDTDRAAKRENRRQSDRKDIEEALDEELEILETLDDDFDDFFGE